MPHLASTASRTVLAEHAHDGHRNEAAVRRLRQIQGGKDVEAKVALEAGRLADWCGETLKPKSPLEAAVPVNWSRETSQKAMYVRTWAPTPQPAPW